MDESRGDPESQGQVPLGPGQPYWSQVPGPPAQGAPPGPGGGSPGGPPPGRPGYQQGPYPLQPGPFQGQGSFQQGPYPSHQGLYQPGGFQPQGGYPAYAPAGGPGPKGRAGGKIVAIVLAVVLVLGGGATAAVLLLGKDENPTPTASPSASASPAPSPTPTPTVKPVAPWLAMSAKQMAKAAFPLEAGYDECRNLAPDIDDLMGSLSCRSGGHEIWIFQWADIDTALSAMVSLGVSASSWAKVTGPTGPVRCYETLAFCAFSKEGTVEESEAVLNSIDYLDDAQVEALADWWSGAVAAMTVATDAFSLPDDYACTFSYQSVDDQHYAVVCRGETGPLLISRWSSTDGYDPLYRDDAGYTKGSWEHGPQYTGTFTNDSGSWPRTVRCYRDIPFCMQVTEDTEAENQAVVDDVGYLAEARITAVKDQLAGADAAMAVATDAFGLPDGYGCHFWNDPVQGQDYAIECTKDDISLVVRAWKSTDVAASRYTLDGRYTESTWKGGPEYTRDDAGTSGDLFRIARCYKDVPFCVQVTEATKVQAQAVIDSITYLDEAGVKAIKDRL